ncbi:hypothetical protein PHPALM_27760 [Phytophthora palmivora]|uniref:Uncharacterized protein n=1 Tax=Phytophthora palmivora TaxID=4796 RepID=A0A2P4XBT5_9STRA|nr:hypothetical protein PHPALM_27760 [Phytophthora palmivora]
MIPTIRQHDSKTKGGAAKLKRLADACLTDQVNPKCYVSKTLKKSNEQCVTNEVVELTTQVEFKLPGGKKTWARAVTKQKLSFMTVVGPVNITKRVACLILEIVAMIPRAVDEDFPVGKIERLRTIVYVYDLWGLTLCSDPPANVEPCELG